MPSGNLSNDFYQEVVFVQRRTAALFTSLNETLDKNEWSVEEDTGLVKVGDGVTPYNNLKYVNGAASGVTDVEFTNASKGVILKDRTTGTRYRLFMNNGVFGTEVVT